MAFGFQKAVKELQGRKKVIGMPAVYLKYNPSVRRSHCFLPVFLRGGCERKMRHESSRLEALGLGPIETRGKMNFLQAVSVIAMVLISTMGVSLWGQPSNPKYLVSLAQNGAKRVALEAYRLKCI